MASKRVTQISVDWAAFAQKVPKGQKAQFTAFKAKSEGYAARVVSLPEALPAINWAQYEGRISIPAMVDNFKKQYESLSVPYPSDVYSSKIDEEQKVAMVSVEKYVKDCQANVAKFKVELARLEAMLPVEEMNLEEFFDAYPDQALNTFDKPTMWPHTPETQPEYLEQMAKEGKFDEAH